MYQSETRHHGTDQRCDEVAGREREFSFFNYFIVFYRFRHICIVLGKLIGALT